MKKKLLNALYTASIFLVPFLSKAQSDPFVTVTDASPLGLNNPPVANNDVANMCQDSGPITIAVQANDTDPDGGIMLTTVISGPSNGTALVVGTNVQYTPDFGFFGVDIINYVICDNGIPSMCDTATITVTVTQAPVADCGPDQTICFGDVTTVGTPAIAGNTYLWTPAAGLSATNIAQPFCSPTVTSTTYTLTVNSTATGCSNTDMVTITVNPIPAADAGPDHTLCQADSVQLGTPGTFGNTYYWTPIAPLNNNSIPQPMASPDSTTTFLLVVTTTATGCFNTDSVVVNITPAPPTNAGPNQTICLGQSVTIGTPAVAGNTYSWFPALGLSSTTTAQPTASPLITTTYILTVTNLATGCTDTDSMVVFVNPPPLAITGPDQTICAGDSVMIGAPQILGNTYLWTPSTGLSADNISNPWASPVVTTTYTLTETAGIGCSATNTVTVTVIPGAIADAGADVTICTGATTVIGIPTIAGQTYLWTPVLGLSSSVIAQPNVTPDSTTTYVLVTVNIATGCIATDSITITVVSPPNANAGPDQNICDGDSVTIGTAAIAGETYSWSPATGLSSSTVAQPNAFPSTTTNYTLTVSNAGCSDNDNVVVNVDPLPVANAGANTTICAGETITLGAAAVAGNTYTWTPATGLSSSTIAQPTVTPTASVTYILTVTNTTTGCTNSDTITITVDSIPTANAGADMTICPGNSAVIGSAATAGFTYSWSPATGLSSSTVAQPTATPATTTTYIVTMTNGTTLCTDTDTVTVTVAPPTAFTGPDQTICQGDSVMLGGAAIAGHTYSWTPSTGLSSTTAANPYASPDTTTTYTLTETAGPGCVNTNTVTVTVNPTGAADAGADQTTCTGSSVTIGTAAVAGMTYSWSPATGLSSTTVAQPTASPAVTTTYYVTVNNTTTGCSKTDSVTVTINAQPLASTGGDQTICQGDSVMIGATPVTGNTYSWTPATGLSSSTIANPYAGPDSTTTYTLTETAGPGCVSTNTVTITVIDAPVADAGADQVICSGTSTTIGTTVMAATTYSWSPSTGLSSTTTAQPTANPTASTTYILTITNTITGCTDSDTVVVTVNTMSGVNAGADVTACSGDSVMIGAAANPGSTYSWTPSTGLSASNVSNPYADPSTTTTYILTETDSMGCTGTDTVTVSTDKSLNADAGSDLSVCEGNSVVIGTTAIAPYTYSWTPSSGLSSSTSAQPDANPSATTTYVLTVTNPNSGCTATDSVTISVNTLPVANAGTDQGICTGDTSFIGTTAVAGYTYDWSPSAGLSATNVSNPSALPTTTTSYIVTVSDGTCTNSDTVVVTVNTLEARLAGDDQLVCDGGAVMIGTESNGKYIYHWTPNTNISSTSAAQPTVNPTENTLYTVEINDPASGCSTKDSVFITVQATGLYNGISPNGDGVNDSWTVPMLDCYPTNTVTILNRWGAEVWKASDYNNDNVKWSGQNLDGESLPDGTYYYVIAYNETEKRGWVFLKR